MVGSVYMGETFLLNVPVTYRRLRPMLIDNMRDKGIKAVPFTPTRDDLPDTMADVFVNGSFILTEGKARRLETLEAIENTLRSPEIFQWKVDLDDIKQMLRKAKAQLIKDPTELTMTDLESPHRRWVA